MIHRTPISTLFPYTTLFRSLAKPGTNLEIELTVEAVRHRVPATVVKTPFFNPKRKTANPVYEGSVRSEEHTSELQSLRHLVCRLLLEKKKKKNIRKVYKDKR